jgi:hypothetical protein
MEFNRDNKFIRLIWYYYSELSDEGYGFDTSKLDILKIYDILSRDNKETGELEVKIILGRPGLLVGKGGKDINNLENHLSEELGCKVKVIVEEFNLFELIY